MGIQVNLYRAIQRIKTRTENKENVYGLFIDFEPMLKRGMKEKIVIGDGRASPSGVIAASRVQGVAFKEIQQAERLKQR